MNIALKITRSIAFRLFLVIGSVQALILAALAFATIRVQHSHQMDNVTVSATRISELIARSTHYSMLLNRKEDVENIITSIGGNPGIEGIRIYNKQGEIIFSTASADVHTTVDMNAEACVSCHTQGSVERHSQSNEELSRIFTKASGERILGVITPIRNEPVCSNADCHAHPESKTILGVLDVRMSLAQVDHRLDESRTQLLVLSVLAVLLVSLISGGFIWMVVRRPVRKLMNGMQLISSGTLGQRLEEHSKDELGQLEATFNTMTEDLARAREENRAWASTLEAKVKEKTADLERAHKQMVRVEKMASLGSLAATVAHELNNPLEGILTFARLIIKKISKSSIPQDQSQAIVGDLRLVADEAQRCGNIVKNLLVFARQSGGAFQPVDLKMILDRCVLLIQHHAQMNSVELETRCESNTVLECDANQVQQALVALMVNGIEAVVALKDRVSGGKLSVTATKSERGEFVTIIVSDNGVGMSDDVKAHMFEPFFTTKSEGKGVGLGLAVVFGIVERHHGRIEVESAVRQGATFKIMLPVTPPRHGGSAPVEHTAGGIRV